MQNVGGPPFLDQGRRLSFPSVVAPSLHENTRRSPEIFVISYGEHEESMIHPSCAASAHPERSELQGRKLTARMLALVPRQMRISRLGNLLHALRSGLRQCYHFHDSVRVAR